MPVAALERFIPREVAEALLVQRAELRRWELSGPKGIGKLIRICHRLGSDVSALVAQDKVRWLGGASAVSAAAPKSAVTDAHPWPPSSSSSQRDAWLSQAVSDHNESVVTALVAESDYDSSWGRAYGSEDDWGGEDGPTKLVDRALTIHAQPSYGAIFAQPSPNLLGDVGLETLLLRPKDLEVGISSQLGTFPRLSRHE